MLGSHILPENVQDFCFLALVVYVALEFNPIHLRVTFHLASTLNLLGSNLARNSRSSASEVADQAL